MWVQHSAWISIQMLKRKHICNRNLTYSWYTATYSIEYIPVHDAMIGCIFFHNDQWSHQGQGIEKRCLLYLVKIQAVVLLYKHSWPKKTFRLCVFHSHRYLKKHCCGIGIESKVFVLKNSNTHPSHIQLGSKSEITYSLTRCFYSVAPKP